MNSYEITNCMGIIVKSVLNDGGKIKITIETGSMSPTIKKGEQIVAISKKNKQIKLGDVIVFRQKYGDSILVHRCMFYYRNRGVKYYITKGDAGLNFDPIINEERVYGIVSNENRQLGNIYYRKIQYILLPVYIVVTIIIRLYMLWNDFYKINVNNIRN